jgi:hypothetical protein
MSAAVMISMASVSGYNPYPLQSRPRSVNRVKNHATATATATATNTSGRKYFGEAPCPGFCPGFFPVQVSVVECNFQKNLCNFQCNFQISETYMQVSEKLKVTCKFKIYTCNFQSCSVRAVSTSNLTVARELILFGEVRAYYFAHGKSASLVFPGRCWLVGLVYQWYLSFLRVIKKARTGNPVY